MKRIYTVSIVLDNIITLDKIDALFRDGYIHDSKIFSPVDTLREGSWLVYKNSDGESLAFVQLSSRFVPHFQGTPSKPMEEIDALKWALTLVRKLNSQYLQFNPNLISMLLGSEGFRSEADFLDNFGQSAINLQKMLYRGGNCYYSSSSGHYSLFLGIKDLIFKHFEKPDSTIYGTGKPCPAVSLDELLLRIV